jgi:hypothetical protein
MSRAILLDQAKSLLRAAGYTIERVPVRGGAYYRVTPPNEAPFVSLIRTSTERCVSAVYRPEHGHWGAYRGANRVLLVTFRHADDPESGIEVYSFPTAEVIDRLQMKRTARGEPDGPTFIRIDAEFGMPWSGLAERFPAIASASPGGPSGGATDDDAPTLSRLERAIRELREAASEEYGHPVEQLHLRLVLVGRSSELVVPLS